jgi:hypothetical protein
MVVLLIAALLSPGATDAGQQPPLQLSLADKPKAPSKSKPPPKPPPPSDDFELLPQEAKPDAAAAAELERQLEKRRTMLHYHQIGGIVTVTALTGTVILGQLDYNDKYGGGGDTGKYHLWHRWLGFATAAIFAGTASLAVFAPVPIPKEPRLDTATMHKILMTTAAAGMLTQIVLGIVTASKEGSASQRDFALAHQIIGYATFGATVAGVTVLAF